MWPDLVAPRDFEGFKQLEEEPVVQQIVCLGSSMGLEMNEELVEIHSDEAESLQQMITFGNKDEDKEKSHGIPAEDLIKVFSCWNKLSKLKND